MKKRTVIIAVAALLLIALCVALFIPWNNRQIDAAQVEKITIGYINAPHLECTSAEAEELIALFNEAVYTGQGTGEGGTPDYQVFIHYKDGSYLIISDFHGINRNFEVSLRDANGKQLDWYYVNSEPLETFLLSHLHRPE